MSRPTRSIKLLTATLLLIGTVVAGSVPAAARDSSATITGPKGGQTNCTHTASGGTGSTGCTGAGGKTGTTGHSATANGDGSVTSSRNSTGPRGKTSGTTTTISR